MSVTEAPPKESRQVQPEEFLVTSAKELIEHLSTEIDTYTKMIFDWRARAAFYWLIGPFIVISSMMIVTKQVPTFQDLDGYGRAAAAVAGICFIVMAYIGARMEAHMADQCNIWRYTILRLTSETNVRLNKSDVIVLKQRVKVAYMAAHALLLVAFLCSMIVVSRSRFNSFDGEQKKAGTPAATPGSSPSSSP